MQELVLDIKNAWIDQGDYNILKEVNLTLAQGEFAYLVGRTGSGKSTFLKMLYGSIPLQKGEAKVVGEDVAKKDWKNIYSLRRKLGIIFQDFNLLMDRSVDENLKFVLRATGWEDESKMNKRVEDSLKDVGLSGKGWKMPHELSGGEQQRVVVARALLNKPRLILADEPTGNLDPETSDDIVRLIRDVAKQHKTAIIFATHNYNIIDTYPSRVIRCRHGKIWDDMNYLV